MTNYDLGQLMQGKDVRDAILIQRARNRLASGDTELQSLLWLLREGVIERRQFPELVASAVKAQPPMLDSAA